MRRAEFEKVVAWAQCDTCQKWRVLPKDHVVAEGAAWTCAAVGRSCDERADDAVEEAQSAAVLAPAPKKKRRAAPAPAPAPAPTKRRRRDPDGDAEEGEGH